MNDRSSIEITGDTVDDAVAKGLASLGAGPGDVIVEVLEEASRGVFGIGARPAKVRLQLIHRPPPPASVSTPEPARTPAKEPDTRPAGSTSADRGGERVGSGDRAGDRNRDRDKDSRREENGGNKGGVDHGGDRNKNRSSRGQESRPAQPRSAIRSEDDYHYNEEEEAYAFAENQGDASGEDGE
ncbi:MAG TPA: Jag N-terminal domain-containing protein, partial [Phototrophicaceae bacterium]|nr:Jag N-terminal domain-containing protein [Phototrophicaceae bacterium]